MASPPRRRSRFGYAAASAATALTSGCCFANAVWHSSSSSSFSSPEYSRGALLGQASARGTSSLRGASATRWRVHRRAFGLEGSLYEVASQAADEVQMNFANGGISPLVLFAAGLASSVNPCNLAVMPSAVAAVAAVSGDDRRSTVGQALAFMLGSGLVLAIVGLGASFVGSQLLQQESPLQWLFPSIAVVMGLSLLRILPIDFNLGTSKLSGMADGVPNEWKGFCLGMASAASTSTCSTPVLVTIVSYITGNVVGPLAAAGLFLAYALGYCLPLAVVSSFTAALPWLQAGSRYGPLLSGCTILAVGVTQFLALVAGQVGDMVSMAVFAATFVCAGGLAWSAQQGETAVMQVSTVPGETGVYRYRPLPAGAASSEDATGQQVELPSERSESRRAAAAAICAAVAYSAYDRRVGADDSLEGRRAIIRRMAQESPPLAAALRSGKPLVVEFSAQWCPDCLTVAPIMKELEDSYGKKVTFVTLDVSYGHPVPEVAAMYKQPDKEIQWWTAQFGVSAIPHIAFVTSDGNVETAFLGAPPAEVLATQIEALGARQPLPYAQFDAFQGRKIVFPSES